MVRSQEGVEDSSTENNINCYIECSKTFYEYKKVKAIYSKDFLEWRKQQSESNNLGSSFKKPFLKKNTEEISINKPIEYNNMNIEESSDGEQFYEGEKQNVLDSYKNILQQQQLEQWEYEENQIKTQQQFFDIHGYHSNRYDPLLDNYNSDD